MILATKYLYETGSAKSRRPPRSLLGPRVDGLRGEVGAGRRQPRFQMSGVVPATVRRDKRVRFGPPVPGLVGTAATVGLQDSIDRRPCGLDRVLPGEERSVAGHGIRQEPLVRPLWLG
jgi:hypothetical protein